MQSVERKTDNLRHRVKILEKVYNDDGEKIKFLEEKLQEERLRRKKMETFVTEKMSKLEESLKKEVARREDLEKWLARFFGIESIQYDGAEEQSKGASAETQEDDSLDLSLVKIEPEATDDGEDTTDGVDAEMTEGSDQDDDESSQKDFKVKSLETSFREIRIQQDGKRASTSAGTGSATADKSDDDRIQKAKQASAMKSFKVKFQPFSCHLCSKRFTLNMKLKSHMKRRHDWIDPAVKKKSSTTPPSMKTVKCTHCSKLFASKASMRKHITVHTPVRAAMFHCPVAGCDRFYHQLNNFGKHLEERHEDCHFDFFCVQCRERPSFGDSMETYVGHMDRYHRGMPGTVEVLAEDATGELSSGSE